MTRKNSMAGEQTPSMRAIPEGGDDLLAQITARPDGYYWRAPDEKQEIGPFATRDLAMADMQAADEGFPEPGETLQEAESELGISDWVDHDTGELAEGQSVPRLEDE